MKKIDAKYLGKVDFSTLNVNDSFDMYIETSLDEDIRTFASANAQYMYEVLDKTDLKIVGPGIYECKGNRYGDLELKPSFINNNKNFEGIDLNNSILDRCIQFFEKAPLIKALGESKVRRGILFYGQAGVGKTHLANDIMTHFISGNDTIICKFDTQNRMSALASLLNTLDPSSEVKKVIIQLEDIGGGEVDPENASRLSETSMLNFLDGNSYSLDVPYIIFATTNYPQNMLANLTDRPGRFDEVIEVHPPSIEVKKKYMESLLKRDLTNFEVKNITKDHSMAHVKEAVISNILYDKSISDKLKEMTEHSNKVKNNFNDDNKMGF